MFSESLAHLLISIGLIAVFIGIVVVLPIYLLTGGIRNFALGPLRRRFNGIQVHEELEPGDVQFIYHTYRGFPGMVYSRRTRGFCFPRRR
jgi:hypothetical protein